VQRFALDYDDLRARNPRLVYAQMTGFGTAGPDRMRRGYDTTGWWARSGIMDMMKPFQGAPVFPVGGVGDHATAMTLFASIMMALYERERTGEGRHVSTSLVANGCWSAGMHLQGAIAGYDVAAILDEKGYRSPLSTVYQARDGRFFVMVLPNPDREWRQLASCLGHPEWLDAYPDVAAVMTNKDTVRALLRDVFAAMDTAQVCEALDREELTYSMVEKLADVIRDAHLIENQVIVRTESDNEDFQWTIANPITVRGLAKKAPHDPPAIGQHTREVLRESGYSDAEIETFLGDGIVRATGQESS